MVNSGRLYVEWPLDLRSGVGKLVEVPSAVVVNATLDTSLTAKHLPGCGPWKNLECTCGRADKNIGHHL